MAENIFYSLVFGFLSGAVYDILLVLYYLFLKKAIQFIVDFLWCIIFAFSFYTFLLAYNDGIFRGLFLLSSLCGVFLWHKTIGFVLRGIVKKAAAILRKIVIKTARAVKFVFNKIKKLLLLPYKLLYNRINKCDNMDKSTYVN